MLACVLSFLKIITRGISKKHLLHSLLSIPWECFLASHMYFYKNKSLRALSYISQYTIFFQIRVCLFACVCASVLELQISSLSVSKGNYLKKKLYRSFNMWLPWLWKLLDFFFLDGLACFLDTKMSKKRE